MKAKDLELEEIISFNDGNIDLQGRRLTLQSIHAFGQFRKDIVEILGTEKSRHIFTRFGYFWGRADASAMRRTFKWDNIGEHIKAGFRLLELEGVARVELIEMECDFDTGRCLIEVNLYGSSESEEYRMIAGWSDESTCWKIDGYLSGYVSFCLNNNIYFLEDACKSRDDKICTFIGRDLQSWDDSIKDQLKYFEADDIKNTIDRLAAELIAKSKELAIKHDEFKSIRRQRDTNFFEYRSKALQNVLSMADRVARFDTSVLITGESGVGKEILAHYIHRNSMRTKGSFVTVNCSALPETLLESELFGHRAGSFTGATRDRAGLFEEAVDGTVFLDEIGDISQTTQLKLLRVLQEKEISRIGENIPRKVDVRIIAATNKNLDTEVDKGNFREDLLYRLRVVEIEIPPLRDRKEDILPLARFFVNKLLKKLDFDKLKLDAKIIDYLHAYSWPGNIREMENAIERAAIFSEDGFIHPENLPPRIIQTGPASTPVKEISSKSLAEIEKEHIVKVLKATSWNRTHSAQILGISSSTLWRKMKEYGISD